PGARFGGSERIGSSGSSPTAVATTGMLTLRRGGPGVAAAAFPERRRRRASGPPGRGTAAASATPVGTLGGHMGLFNKILHAGEGRKLKLVESIVPEVAAFEPAMEARSDEELRAMTGTVRSRLDQAPGKDERVAMLDDMLPEAFA